MAVAERRTARLRNGRQSHHRHGAVLRPCKSCCGAVDARHSMVRSRSSGGPPAVDPTDLMPTSPHEPTSPVALTGLLGSTIDVGVQVTGKLRDVGVGVHEERPLVSSLIVEHGGTIERLTKAVVVDGLGRIAPGELPPGEDELLLRRDVLDRQVFDGAGKRLSRVADVLLDASHSELRVVAVETGIAGILRRLGARRLAGRLGRQTIDWRDLHLLSGPGHALQLASPRAAVHRLDPESIAELVRRAPSRRGAEVVDRLHPDRSARVRAALAKAVPRRRSADPLSARRRAPS